MYLTKNNYSLLLVPSLILVGVLYLYLPIITTFFILFSLFFISEKTIKKTSFLIPIFISINISLINLIKFPESDLVNYLRRYLEYGELSFIDFFLTIKSDFIFHYINKLLYLFSDGSISLYILTWSFIIYILLTISIHKLFILNKINKQAFIFSLIFLTFTTPFLSISIHLIRQTAAVSILIYFIVSLYCGNRKNYLLPIMVFTHFSSILLLIPIFIKSKKFYLSLSLLAVFVLLTQINIFEKVISVIPIIDIGYINILIHHMENASINHNNDGEISILLYIISITLLIPLYFRYLINKENDLYIILFPFYYSFLLIIIFSPIDLLTLRYAFYQYSFYFVIIPLIITFFNEKFKPTYLFLWPLSILYFLKFYNYFEINNWSNKNLVINETTLTLLKYINLY